MGKSVYSLVLMDDIVAAVDRLAYQEGTSRSNMVNRILAEYVQMDTPENRIRTIFDAVNAVLGTQSALRLCAHKTPRCFCIWGSSTACGISWRMHTCPARAVKAAWRAGVIRAGCFARRTARKSRQAKPLPPMCACSMRA